MKIARCSRWWLMLHNESWDCIDWHIFNIIACEESIRDQFYREYLRKVSLEGSFSCGVPSIELWKEFGASSVSGISSSAIWCICFGSNLVPRMKAKWEVRSSHPSAASYISQFFCDVFLLWTPIKPLDRRDWIMNLLTWIMGAHVSPTLSYHVSEELKDYPVTESSLRKFPVCPSVGGSFFWSWSYESLGPSPESSDGFSGCSIGYINHWKAPWFSPVHRVTLHIYWERFKGDTQQYQGTWMHHGKFP